jgi:hypothetical protein
MNTEDPDVYLVNVSPAKGDEELRVAVTVTISGKPDALVPTTKLLLYQQFKETMARIFKTSEDILSKNDDKILHGKNVVIYMTVSPDSLVSAGFMDASQLSR